MKDTGICILGAGCAGFGASHHLFNEGIQPVIYEAHAYHGGHTASHRYNDGFIFDEGPHISFTKNERIKSLFEESCGGEFEEFASSVNNYWQGHWIKHPAQVNLAGVPTDLIVKCITEFVDAKHADRGDINNYKDWLYATFGPTFSDTFPGQYTKKYHTTAPENLTTDWLGPRIYQPEIEEVLRGALTRETEDVHYIPNFRYPTNGGFVSYLKMFARRSTIHAGHRVVEIDPVAKILSFAGGKRVGYEKLISSIPLPALVPLVKGAPSDVLHAASKLACSQVVLVNIGLNHDDLPEHHWTYFYDDEFDFSRLSFPHRFSRNVAPAGCSAIQAEIYFSDKWKPRTGDLDSFIEPTIRQLMKCGLVKDPSEIVHKSTLYAPWGNVIFDHDRSASLSIVHDFLRDVGIHYCGRFGEWGYIWTDESFVSGERAAKRVLEEL